MRSSGGRLAARGSSTCCHPQPLVNLLARLEPAAIWSDGLFMEPGDGSPGPDPANLEAINGRAVEHSEFSSVGRDPPTPPR